GVVSAYLEGSKYRANFVYRLLDRERNWLRRWQILRTRPWREMRILHAVNAMGTLPFLAGFKFLGCAIVLHWVGSDYRRLASYSRPRRAAVIGYFRRLKAVHLIDSPELQGDLARIGIHGTVVRLVPRGVDAQPVPMPEQPAVLAYWSADRADFYGRPIIY